MIDLPMTMTPAPGAKSLRLHIICERDVGLFSLIQQVISNIAWALAEDRIPIAFFQGRTCYWTPDGYQNKDTVWEYYFEPIVPGHAVSSIPQNIRATIDRKWPSAYDIGYYADEDTFVSAHFGDHKLLEGKSLFIPWRFEDPDPALRKRASEIIGSYIHPRSYLQEKADRFYRSQMDGRYVIGVHIRGTDAVSSEEARLHRRGSLRLWRYAWHVERMLHQHPDAAILVATDAESSLRFMKLAFGTRVVAYDSLRHKSGKAAATGPTGWLMPAYIAGDRYQAAKNGEEAVIEYLLLARCDCLIHNGASLARTVLLKVPDLPHINTHTQPPLFLRWRMKLLSAVRRRLHWLAGSNSVLRRN